jgi:RIP metalloprotease RseP
MRASRWKNFRQTDSKGRQWTHSFLRFLLFGGYAIPFLIVLGIVVFVHEFGHFWVARRCGVKVETFSIGFGPEIYAWHDRHGTRWRVAWLPLGGYVKMFGDADPSSFGPDEEAKAFTEEEEKEAFYAQSVRKRFAVVAAGPAANYLFAAVLLALSIFLTASPTPRQKSRRFWKEVLLKPPESRRVISFNPLMGSYGKF